MPARAAGVGEAPALAVLRAARGVAGEGDEQHAPAARDVLAPRGAIAAGVALGARARGAAGRDRQGDALGDERGEAAGEAAGDAERERQRYGRGAPRAIATTRAQNTDRGRSLARSDAVNTPPSPTTSGYAPRSHSSTPVATYLPP